MSLTQFAMVEELAFLVKDNLRCKHLVLSIEEVLVNFLQEDTSAGGVLKLEPMNSYERLLIHRLAEIFGFSHQSVGEGEDRHLILERCPETSIPSILVSDLLWQSDEVQSSMIFDAPGPKKIVPGQRDSRPSLEERESNYLAARERIFSAETSQPELLRPRARPRNNPVVAHRMIAHALGKSNKLTNEDASKEDEEITAKDMKSENVNECRESEKSGEKNIGEKYTRKVEHMGAAKRLFANALGIPQQRERCKAIHENE